MRTTAKPSFAQVKDIGTGEVVILARGKIVAVEPCKVYGPPGGKMVPKIRVRMMTGITYIIDAEPTLENMQSLMPL